MAFGYRICRRCVMDTSDPAIVFDAEGFCNHCTKALLKLSSPPLSLKGDEKEKELGRLVAQIKSDGAGKKYDCIIGVSGGVDSSYVAYLVKKMGLRPLAVHLDNGWDSELAVKNIENLIKKLEIDLHTRVLDWEEFRDLQLSFLKASVPDLEIPTDHAIIAVLFDTAAKYGVKYIISGHNTATESIGVPAWSNGHYDWRYIQNVQRMFGSRKLRDFPHLGPLTVFYHQFIRRIRRVHVLDYVDYNKKEVIAFLESEFGWRNYATKHGESVYTHFIQSHILPTKFGYDKRRMHLSNLVCLGQLTREEAVKKLSEPLFSDAELKEMIEYVTDKFGISAAEFGGLMKLPNRSYSDYPSYVNHPVYGFLKRMYKKVKPFRA